MLIRLAVFNSDQLNRSGSVFPVRTLEQALRATCEMPRPSALSHDAHRIAGATRTLGLYFTPGVTRLMGLYLTPETSREREAFVEMARRHIRNLPEQLRQSDYEDLKSRLADVLNGSEVRIVANGAALHAPGLARKVFPEVFDRADKDGLVPMGGLQEMAPGVFEGRGLMFYAHSYLRRSLSRLNTLNEPFLRLLTQLSQERPDLDVRLALDPDVVGLASSYVGSVELVYWWGPKFNDDLPTIEMGSGAHGGSPEQREYYGLEKCDFLWYSEGAVGKDTSFACEEVVVVPSYGVDDSTYGLRYAHSRMGSRTGFPVHLDGAIRFYAADELAERTEQKLNETGRGAKYVKLWRVDSPPLRAAATPDESQEFERNHSIPVQIWKALLTHYYRDNSLVGEYLKAYTEEAETPTAEVISTPEPLDVVVPVRMEPGDGVRVSVCYDCAMRSEIKGRELVPTGCHGEDEANARPYVEADTLEVVKMLRRRGLDLEQPPDLAWLSIGDRTLNLPLIRHYGPEAYSLTIETLKVLAEFVNAESRSGAGGRLVAYSVELPYEDRTLRYSVAGNVGDLCRWHATQCALPPDSVSKLGDWAESIKESLEALFGKTAQDIPVGSLLRKDGVLSFPRVPLEADQWDLLGTPDGRGALKKQFFANLKPEIQDLVTQGRLGVAPVIEIVESRCFGCGEAYPSCPCIKSMDAVCVEVVSHVVHEAYWTANPA